MVVLRMIGFVALVALVGACSDGFVPPPSAGGGSGGTGAAGGTAGTAGTGATAGTGGGAGSGGTGGVSGTGGMGGGGGIGGMGGAGGIGGIGGVGGSVGGACVNEPDLDVIRMTLPRNLRWQAASCGTPCQGLAHDAFLVCVNQCVETQVPGLTSECTSCYGELAWCAGTASTTCNPWCANQTLNACTPDCTADSTRCPGYSACLSELDQCAGRDSLDCLNDT